MRREKNCDIEKEEVLRESVPDIFDGDRCCWVPAGEQTFE